MGYFRHWWVAAKFAITIGQLYAGVFVLSKALRGPLATGVDAPVEAVALGAGLMATGLAFQTWLSVAKPWGRTPLARAGERGATAPGPVFVAGVAASVADVAVGMALDVPLPALSIAVLVVALVLRARTGRAGRQAGPRPVSSASSGP